MQNFPGYGYTHESELIFLYIITVSISDHEERRGGSEFQMIRTCGDAVAGSHIDFVQRKTGITFGKPELDRRVDGVIALSPDMESRFPFDGVGYTLDRPEFETKLLQYALKNGVEYQSEFEVQAPVVENNFLMGIKGKNKKNEIVTSGWTNPCSMHDYSSNFKMDDNRA